jgi:hypothetical protein
VGGTLTVGSQMTVVGSAIGGGVVSNNLYIRQLNQLGSPAHLCWRVAPDGVQALLITTCTQSLRDKAGVRPLEGGLDLVRRLKPISFAWDRDGERDFGFGAEDVAEVEPLLVTRNDKGQVADVRHEGLTAVLVSALQEQQGQIARQQQLLQELKTLVCREHPGSGVCGGQ